MSSKFLLFLLPFWLLAEELEVRLTTQSPLQPIYLTELHVPRSEHDWRYFDELRSIFAFDLNTNGFTTTLPKSQAYEEQLRWPDVRDHFNIGVWKKEQIPYVLTIQVFQNRFELIVFDIAKGSSKKYPDCPLTGRLEEDRKKIHRLADTVQKDLFGVEGIASLRILYSQRQK